ncbi:MAG: hypothetical protein ABEL76_13450 [Bradymonadaceae bacterium]
MSGDKESLFKELGKLALEKAVETLVEEGIEAAVEIWKKYRLKVQEHQFETDAPDDSGSSESASAQAGSVSSFDASTPDERRSYPGGAAEEETEEGGESRIESLGRFAQRRSTD